MGHRARVMESGYGSSDLMTPLILTAMVYWRVYSDSCIWKSEHAMFAIEKYSFNVRYTLFTRKLFFNTFFNTCYRVPAQDLWFFENFNTKCGRNVEIFVRRVNRYFVNYFGSRFEFNFNENRIKIDSRIERTQKHSPIPRWIVIDARAVSCFPLSFLESRWTR